MTEDPEILQALLDAYREVAKKGKAPPPENVFIGNDGEGNLVSIADINECIEGLREEVKELTKTTLEQARLLGISGEKELKLLARIERLEKALEFYADLLKYIPDQDGVCILSIEMDSGDKAREALKETE